MIDLKGQHNTARVFTDTLEKGARQQILALCDMEQFADSTIRVMPDVHAGMGSTIGTTMTIRDKVVPGMVGVDIGCGMETVRLSVTQPDLKQLDNIIRRHIPSGRDIRREEHPYNQRIDLTQLKCGDQVNIPRARRSIGTLGGGNHFIEIGRDEEDRLWLVVHSGSRHLGHEVAMLYQRKGFDALCGVDPQEHQALIRRLKSKGKEKQIDRQLKRLRRQAAAKCPIPRDMAWVEGQAMRDYLHDMALVQRFAVINRQAMIEVILRHMDWQEEERFTTTHNYIDLKTMILRKGAVSAQAGERLLIPINMRDGSLICRGLGNPDWNHSAPHGAGRLMSRTEAKAVLSMDAYRQTMAGVYTTSVSEATLDEAPMAYKDEQHILRHISPTAEVLHRVRPIYNYKAAD